MHHPLENKQLTGGKNMKAELKISGIHCKSCIALIKMNINELKGIKKIENKNGNDTITVEFNDKETKTREIIKSIEKDGYKVESIKETK